MKVLILYCVDCGKTKEIRGATVDAILARIDESEWVDVSGVAHSLPKPHQAARCPACSVVYFAKVSA